MFVTTRASSLLLLGVTMLVGWPANGSAQNVTISRDRLTRIAPASNLREVTKLSRAGVDTVQVSNRGLQLDAGTFAILKTGETLRTVPGPIDSQATAVNTNPFIALPYQLLTPDATGASAWELRPIYKVAVPLRWDQDSARFRGAIFIAIEDPRRRGSSRPLPTPVRFQLSADADRVTPDAFELNHTNFPLTRVAISARRAEDSVRVNIAGEFDVHGVNVWLPVEPTLRVETNPPRIQGWGVGSTRVVVRVVGSRTNAPRAVTLSATNGELENVTVPIGDGLSGSTTLRSVGVDGVILTAAAPGFDDAVATVDFTWPVMFLLAALLGGAVGGVFRGFRERKTTLPNFWWRAAGLGVSAGLIAAIAWYLLGINLLQFALDKPRMNELAVFGVALLAGFGMARFPSHTETPKEQPAPVAAGN